MRWPWKKEVLSEDKPYISQVWPSFDSDKCDACPSPAKVRIFVPHTAHVLDFCGHHFRKYEKKLTELGYMWIDGRKEEDYWHYHKEN